MNRIIKIMRKLLFIIGLFLIYMPSYSQVQNNDIDTDGGGFGSLMVSFRSLNKNLAFYTGGGGGFIVKDMRIGVFFNGLTNSYSKNDTSTISFKIGCSYGGLWFGYPLLKKKKIHIIPDVKFSIGSVRLINTNWIESEKSVFLGITPALGVEYAVSDILIIGGGVEYHYSIFKNPLKYYDTSLFSSPGVYLSIKVGSFKLKGTS